MIDRDTAIEWAREAGFLFLVVDGSGTLGCPHVDSVEQVQALITRVRNEAIEDAALLAEQYTATRVAKNIRGMKE